MTNELEDQSMQVMIRQLLAGVVHISETLANPEENGLGNRLINATAIFAGKQRDAFVSQGFSREEAVALIGQQMAFFKLNSN